MVNVHFQPLPLFSFYKKMGYNIVDYPNAYKAYSCEISLPIFYDITLDQIKIVVKTLVQIVHKIL